MLIYIAWDGDHIGRKVGRASLNDDVEGLRRVSQAIDHGNQIWKSWVELCGGSLISMGGDEGRAEIPADKIDELPRIREQYAGAVDAPVSVGVGTKLSEADKALVAAKLQGGDRILFFTEEVDTIVAEARKHGEKTEEQKITDEYLTKGQPAMNPGAFAGASRPSAPTIDKPSTGQGDHEEGQEIYNVVNDENAPAAPEATHAGKDFERQLHEEAWKGHEEDMQGEHDSQKQAQRDQAKQTLVQALQVLKQQAPVLEQLKGTAPGVYQAMMGLTQATVGLARELVPAQQPMQKAERPKRLPKGFLDSFKHVESHVRANDPHTGSIRSAGRYGLNQMRGEDYLWPAQPMSLDVNHPDLDERDPASPEDVHRYSQQIHGGSEPPAVFGIYNPRGKFVNILDGAHRLASKRVAGQKTIGAYIGLPKEMAGQGHWVEKMRPFKVKKAEGEITDDGETHLHHLPKAMQQTLLQHRDPQQLEGALANMEPEIARHIGRGDFMYCDDAASLMSDVLKQHGVPHQRMVGQSDSGESHQWVRVAGKDYDPTRQGFGDPAKASVTEDHRPVMKQELEKAKLPMPNARPHHDVVLPTGSVVDQKIKVQHQDGTSSWKQVEAGQIRSQDPNGHPTSSRSPGSK